MSTIALIIVGNYTNYRNSKFDQHVDTFNEVKLLVIMQHMLLFTPYVDDVNTKELMGYSCFAVVGIGLIINVVSVGIDPIKDLKRKMRIQWHKKRARKHLKTIKPRFMASNLKERNEKKDKRRRARIQKLMEKALVIKKKIDRQTEERKYAKLNLDAPTKVDILTIPTEE